MAHDGKHDADDGEHDGPDDDGRLSHGRHDGPDDDGVQHDGLGDEWSANLNLSANDVTAYLGRWITMSGNPHIKVGSVTEKDANTITADIVTTDKDALVQRFNVDRHTGVYTSVQ